VRPESAEAIIEIARSAFVTLDADGRVLEWNRRAVELFDYPR
jgi:PAS domain-containing protein